MNRFYIFHDANLELEGSFIMLLLFFPSDYNNIIIDFTLTNLTFKYINVSWLGKEKKRKK